MSAKDKEKENEQKESAEAKAEENGTETAEEQKDEKENKENSEEDKVEQLETQVNELNDKYLRLYSEFDNFRKRTLKEKVELGKRAGMEIMESLLPVLDDFERALDNIQKAEDVKSLEEGVELIYTKFKGTLEQKGLKPMESSKGQKFDEELHEAVTQTPAPSDELKGKVVDEIERGYYLNGTVIRYAKVVVGS